MGQNVSNYFSSGKNLSVLMLGLDGAGKTTILHRLKHGEFVETQPTIGFNREEIEYKNNKFTVWDIHTPAPNVGGFCSTVNGEVRINGMWRPYFETTQALIYVVDSSGQEFLKRAREEMHAILSDPLVAGRKLLVLANETNAETALSTTELTERLYLNVIRGREWDILKCNAKSGEGLNEALEWFMRK